MSRRAVAGDEPRWRWTVTTDLLENRMPCKQVFSAATARAAVHAAVAVWMVMWIGTPTSAWGQDKKMIRIGVTKIVSHAALDADEKGFDASFASAGFK